MTSRIFAVALTVACCFMFGRAVDNLPAAPPYPDPDPRATKHWDGWMQIDHPTYVLVRTANGLYRCRVTTRPKWRCVRVNP